MAGNKKKSTSSKKKKGGKRTSQTQSGRITQSFATADIHQVLQQADVSFESSNLENALQLYTYAANVLRKKRQEASPMSNSSTHASEKDGESHDVLLFSRVLGKLGEVKTSLGDEEGGRQDFLEAVNVLNGDQPVDHDMTKAQWKEARASLYLYLGQLQSSSEALETFTRAIHDLKECLVLLESMLTTPSGIEETVQTAWAETRSQLCGAYCSVAELYLTDLCYATNAEQDCEKSLEEALKLDEPTSSPDAVQAMANLRLSQNRGCEAISFILEAYNRVKVGCEALADLVGLGADADQEMDTDMDDVEHKAKELQGEVLDAANSLPGFEFRCQMAKLLLECAHVVDDGLSTDRAEELKKQKKQCAENAIQVLGSLLAENDEVIEIWFLLGCAFAACEPRNDESSRYYFETALNMLEQVKNGLEEEAPTPEVTAEISGVDQLIQDVKEKLKSIDGTQDDAME